MFNWKWFFIPLFAWWTMFTGAMLGLEYRAGISLDSFQDQSFITASYFLTFGLAMLAGMLPEISSTLKHLKQNPIAELDRDSEEDNC